MESAKITQLYEVTMKRGSFGTLVFLVLALDESRAARYVEKCFREWNYSSGYYAASVVLIAGRGRHGVPAPLLEAQEAPDDAND